DVQDAILDDPERAPHVDIIDIRYWYYSGRGGTYGPQGGQNLAPRQHQRQGGGGGTSFASIVRAVREYRTRFPEKAVLYYSDLYCRSGRDGWAVLMGGGSLPHASLPDSLAATLPQYLPDDQVVARDGRWC